MYWTAALSVYAHEPTAFTTHDYALVCDLLTQKLGAGYEFVPTSFIEGGITMLSWPTKEREAAMWNQDPKELWKNVRTQDNNSRLNDYPWVRGNGTETCAEWLIAAPVPIYTIGTGKGSSRSLCLYFKSTVGWSKVEMEAVRDAFLQFSWVKRVTGMSSWRKSTQFNGY